jgi:hypothetical protein
MPDPERLRKTIDRAVDAVRRQPGRRGRLIELRDADEVLVAGDLHGNIGNFQAIYKIADLAGHPHRHLVLQEVVHGKFRYPLGGDKSHQLLDLFAALKNQFPARVHLLLGNHELAQWTDRPIIKAEEDLNVLFINGLQEAYGEGANGVYDGYRQLFAALPLAIRTANRIFLSHSLPTEKHRDGFLLSTLEQDEHRAEDLAPKGVVYSLVWGRDCSAANTAGFLEKVACDYLVSGHIPCEHGFATPNEQQIILDSCASPAAYALLPANRPLTRNEFYATVYLL